MAYDINRAISRNSSWSHRLGWARYYARILGLFHSAPRNPLEFAEAVAQWQHFHRPRLEVDGIIGPNTWAVMRRDLGIATAPAVDSDHGNVNPRQHYAMAIRGHTINFYVYVDVRHSRDKVQQLERFFSRLPDQHLAVLYPIFIMEKKPGGKKGGGTWRPSEVPGSFLSAGHVRNTGIPSEDIERLVINPGKGLIGLSKDRWERPIGRLEYTVLHEIGHCVDYAFQPGGLIPAGTTAADFAGMQTDLCGAGNMMVRRAVEAYARYICSPSRTYHNVVPSESRAVTNQRIIDTLRRSPAFRPVSESWNP